MRMRFFLTKAGYYLTPYWKRLLAIVILLVIGFASIGIENALVAALPDQNAWRRWSDEGDYGQISIYFNDSLYVTPNTIREYEYKLQNAMNEQGAGVEDESEKDTEDDENVDDSRNFIDCYSAPGLADVSVGDKDTTVRCEGVGGDFFLFHPLELVSGSFFQADSDMKDMIVIDEDLAWTLYGSSDIVGMTVNVGGVPHIISGVVARQRGRIPDAAGLDDTVMYMSYQSLVLYGQMDSSSKADTDDSGTSDGQDATSDEIAMSGEIRLLSSEDSVTENGGTDSGSSSDSGSYSDSDSGSGSGDGSTSNWAQPLTSSQRAELEDPEILSTYVAESGGISCYEVMMPDAIDNFAAALIRQNLGPKDNTEMKVIDNKQRFGFLALLNVIKSFPSRSMQMTYYTYPYWENIARGWEDILIYFVIIQLVTFVTSFLLLAWVVVSWYNNRTWRTRDVVRFVSGKVYDAQARRKRL